MTAVPYSIRQEAEHIFRDTLLRDQRLGLPQKVASASERTTFDTTAIDTACLPVPWKFFESSAALWALAATYGNAIAKERFGVDQDVVVNTDVASLFLCSSLLVRVNGKSFQDSEIGARVANMNATKSLAMIGLPPTNPDLDTSEKIIAEISSKVEEYDADWLDTEANQYWRQAGTICLTEDEFHTSEQGKAIKDDGIYVINQFDTPSLPPTPYPTVSRDKLRPLEGLKMIDISRPDIGPLLIDGNLGKRDVSLDLKSESGRATLRRLISDADVVLDGYRPGALDRLGLGADYCRTLARRRGRGVVVVRENCYGWSGPLAPRSGWQQISDCFTGVAWGMGRFLGLNEPVVPPLPNSNYQTGLAGLVGILAAVDRRATDGGSYVVDVSLNQYNQWLLSLGQLAPRVQRALRELHPRLALRHHDDMLNLTTKLMQSLVPQVPGLFASSSSSSII
uniref:CAIB/BAIF family enzyme n=1 Tax=Pyricularia oryzae (strain P131) TaxID=1143193 RepID=L7IYV5_PYRO1